MRLWRSFFEVFQFPLKVLLLGVIVYGIGNILINPAFSSIFEIKNDVIILIGELFNRLGSLIIVNSPILFLLRGVNRRVNAGTTIMAGFIGYLTFLVMTMLFASKSLPSTAFSPILGISFVTNNIPGFSGVNYPLQTGAIGMIIVILITRLSYKQSRNKSGYGFFAFLDKDIYAVIINIFYCALAGILVAVLFTPFYEFIFRVITFISKDITNPMSLFTYGVTERLMTTFHLSNIIRTPFWFQANGGTWANLVGESIAGDVNIWTVSLAANQLQQSSGKFITPYYVLNIFAIPGLIWGIFSIYTDKFEKRRLMTFFIIATLVSVFTGVLYPLEILLFMLAPLLYLFHIVFTGGLFATFQALGYSLGFNYSGSSAVVASPGTLIELITYIKNPNLMDSIRWIVIVGVISGIVYFFFTRFYFLHLAVDLFNTGNTKRMTEGTLVAIGGTSNIKMINTSVGKLTIQLFDPTVVDANKLLSLGATRVTETKAGLSIHYGAASTIVGKSLKKSLRDTLRSE